MTKLPVVSCRLEEVAVIYNGGIETADEGETNFLNDYQMVEHFDPSVRFAQSG